MQEKTVIEKPVIMLTGPTAIGKTELSIMLALTCICEIISVDSMQIYRYMDIGTAKASEEERATVPHHLVDIIDPDQNYSAAQFSIDALTCIQEIHKKDKVPLLTGGTGLYFKALQHGLFESAPADDAIREMLKERGKSEGLDVLYDELSLYDRISANRIHKNDTYRIVRALEVYHSTGIPLSEHIRVHQLSQPRFEKVLMIGLTCNRELLYERINQRTDVMLQHGFEEEVRSLLARGYSRDLKSMQSIGYRHMLNYIFKEWSFKEMKMKLARDTRRYAKRQYTWFNSDPSILWHDPADRRSIENAVSRFLESDHSG